MSKEEQTSQLIRNLQKLLPNSLGLRWDDAVSLERRGHKRLINGECNEAIALYGRAAKKEKLLTMRDDKPDRDDKALFLARSVYHLASVCQKSGRFDESRAAVQQEIETVQTIRTRKYQNESRQFLQDAYRMMADLVPWMSLV